MSETLLLPKSGRFLPGPDAISEPDPPLVDGPFITMLHREIDLGTTPGRCCNLDYCSVGMRRELVRVPVTKPFVCPECGGALRPPGQAARRGASVLPIARLVALLGGVTAGLVVGYLAGRAQTPVVQAAARVRHAAEGQFAAVTMVLDPAQAAVHPSAINPGPPGDPRLPDVVAYRPWATRTAPAAPATPPGRLLHEARAGRVVIECTLAALVTQPVCALATSRGQDAVSTAALAWLQRLRVQYAPAPDSLSAAAPDHRWRVVFEDYAGQQKRALP